MTFNDKQSKAVSQAIWAAFCSSREGKMTKQTKKSDFERKSKPKRKRAFRRLPTPNQLKRGLFIDFEGYKPHAKQSCRPPALVGYRIGIEGPVKHVVFSCGFFGVAKETGLEVRKWKAFLKELHRTHRGPQHPRRMASRARPQFL
mgnify:CR=1 FL=1